MTGPGTGSKACNWSTTGPTTASRGNRGSIPLVDGRKYDLVETICSSPPTASPVTTSPGSPGAHPHRPDGELQLGQRVRDPNVGQDLFSVRWTNRTHPPSSETHRFQANTDDGARLWANNVKLVDNWIDHEKGGSACSNRCGQARHQPNTSGRPPHTRA